LQARETEYKLASALKQVEIHGQMIAAIQNGSNAERSEVP
jgi:sulfur carrier protein ThiS